MRTKLPIGEGHTRNIQVRPGGVVLRRYFQNLAALMEPATGFPLKFFTSATSDLISSLYTSQSGIASALAGLVGSLGKLRGQGIVLREHTARVQAYCGNDTTR